MKRSLTFGFLLMGFSFTVTQGLLIRELLVAFFGNELSIGLVLGSWLILEAAGSGLLGRLANRWGGRAVSFALLQVLYALFLPLCLYAAYASRSLVGAIPGEGVGLSSIFWSSLLILSPVALVDGAMFAFGARSYAHLTGDEAPSIARVYVVEALGGLLGGLVFTYLFIPFLHALQIVVVLSGLNLLAAVLILASSGPVPLRGLRLALTTGLVVLLLGLLGFLVSPLPGQVQRWAIAQQWPGYDLLYSENSVYGNVAVIQRESQYTFYADGIPILTAPVPDVAQAEEIVHLPMLFVPQPRRVLVLSGGLGGVLSELAKYPLQSIDYAELDPLLIEAVKAFPTPLTQSELGDRRLGIELVDGRLLVRDLQPELAGRSQVGYDLILVNLPYPSTLQLNRFYTVEFFQMLRAVLADEGVVLVRSPGSLSYMSAELRDLNAMVYHTLRQAFDSVRPIPGEGTLWLASPSSELLTLSVEDLVARWLDRNLDTSLLTPAHIQLRLDQRYVDWFWSSLGLEPGPHIGDALLEPGSSGAPQPPGPIREYINRDLRPMGLMYGLAYWNALFSPRLARLLAVTSQLNLWVPALSLLAAVLAFLAIAKLTGRAAGAIMPVAIAATGFTGMTADLIIIFAFQSLYGYVYHWVGLLITAFMAGLSLGGWLMSRREIRRGGERAAFLRLEVALVLFWLLLPALLGGFYARLAHPLPPALAEGILFVLNAAAGFLVGAQFPLANQIWLKGREPQTATTGILYASDLVGAFLASLLVSIVLMPVLGILETCLLAALLKLGSLLLVALLLPRS